MKTFNVLPTDDRFTSLTDEQIGFILSNMAYDNKIEERIRKGINPDSYFEDESDNFWDTPHDEFEALKEDHDEEAIANQVESMTNQEDLAKIRARFKTSQEWTEYLESGGKAAEEVEKESYIQEQLKKLFDDAESLNKAGISKWGETQEEKLGIQDEMVPLDEDSIQDAIALFNGDDDDFKMPTIDDDDDFII